MRMVYCVYEITNQTPYALLDIVRICLDGGGGNIRFGFDLRRWHCLFARTEFRCGFFMGFVLGICARTVCERDFFAKVPDGTRHGLYVRRLPV